MLRKAIKFSAAVTLATLMSGALFSTVSAQEKVKISIGHLSTIQSPNIAGTIGEIRSALEATGKVEVTLYGSGTSFSVPNKFSEMVSQGVIDMAFGANSFEPGRFPLNLLITEPFLVRDHVAGSRAFTRAVRENADLQKEYAPNHLVMVMLTSPEQIHSRKPIKSFDDIKGMRILGNSPSMLAIYREAGASTVALPLPAQYENLQKGVVDAVSSSFTSLIAFKLTEVTTDHFWLSSTAPANFLIINEQKYQSLPAEVKKVIDSYKTPEASARWASVWTKTDEMGRAELKAKNQGLVTATPAEVAAIKKKYEFVVAKKIQEVDKAGRPGTATLKAITQALTAEKAD